MAGLEQNAPDAYFLETANLKAKTMVAIPKPSVATLQRKKQAMLENNNLKKIGDKE